MMLTGRNEWIAIAVLIAYIAFVPCPYAMKEFFGTPVGKAVALAVFVYAFKYVSIPIAILLLVNFLRSGGVREYLDEEGLTPPTVPTSVGSENNFTCPDDYTYVAEKMMCMKGNESKNPDCTDMNMSWDSMVGKCVNKPTTSSPVVPPASTSGGPSGGTSPGSMAALNEMANSSAPPTTTESFTPYGGKAKDFAPL
jgi:hypothetical protein